MTNGKFLISLDFELMWGVRDLLTIENYGTNILGVQTVIPKTLDIFDKYNVKGTFSIVGFLFLKNKDELLNNLPNKIPNYSDKNLSPFEGYINALTETNINDNYHFSPNLIQLINNNKNHEIGTHTYSHYYCLEKGQTIDDFRADIEKAIAIANKWNIKLTSLIFPRNQFNDEYLNVCNDLGIICYRGNEHSWLYKAQDITKEKLLRKILRYADAYINISGQNCYSKLDLNKIYPINLPSSRFLRPYSDGLKFLEFLKLHRIKSSMTHAAKQNKMYHLWWHPHNFGINQDHNFKLLDRILNHYKYLNHKYNFESITMTNLAKELNNE
ncbi:MAG: polysaccharide deacetylase family protein [Flavobacterium sp.]|nr:polysaccharide deacetylase family protein [Flavobacterium sp.]